MSEEMILNANIQLNDFILSNGESLSSSLENTKFKITSRAMLSYIARAGYVNNAILSCYGSRNGYSIGIVFRSMIEHSFRHLYLHTRALKEDSDEVGEEYYGKLKGTENLNSMRKLSNYNKNVYPERTVWNFAGEHKEAIKDVGGKFEISKIFTYVIDNIDSEETVVNDGMKEYLKMRLNQYAHLSSYIHGGPYAEICHEHLLKNSEKMSEHIETVTHDSFNLYKNMVQTTVLFASLFEEKHWSAYESVSNIKLN